MTTKQYIGLVVLGLFAVYIIGTMLIILAQAICIYLSSTRNERREFWKMAAAMALLIYIIGSLLPKAEYYE